MRELFWRQVLTGKDPPRRRMASALSRIFVISMMEDHVGNNPCVVAVWLDMLGDEGMGRLSRYRERPEAVSLRSAMGSLQTLCNSWTSASTWRTEAPGSIRRDSG